MLFRDFLDNELGGVYVIQGEVFVYVNQRLCDLFGYKQDEICGRLGPMALTETIDKDVAQAEISSRLTGKTKTGHYVFWAVRKDGTNFYAEVFGVRTTYNGAPAIVGILIDVDEWVVSQKRDEDQARFIAQLIDLIPIPLFYKDTKGYFLGCNESFETFLGLDRKDIIAKTVYDFAPETLAKIYDAADRRLFASPGLQTYDSKVRNAAGIERNVIFNKTTFNDSDGNLAGLLGVFRDVTEERSAQEDLRLADEAFVNSQQAIVVMDGEGRVLKINPAFTHMTGLLSTDVLGQPSHYIQCSDSASSEQAARVLALQQSDKWEGDLQGCHKNGAHFIEHAKISAVRDELGQISRYVSVSSDMTEFRRYQHQIEHMALYDPLTNLANRTLLFQRLSEAIDRSKNIAGSLAVCFLDLDDFKPINDSHGHNLGDHFLIEISTRLQGLMTKGNLVARLGGDEFVLVFENIKSGAEFDKVITRIMTAVGQPCRVDSVEMRATTSVGVAIFPQDGLDSDTLIRHADQAMYVAKRAGKNRHHFFDAKLDQKIWEGRQFVTRVGQGLHAGEFRLYYQPKVDLQSGRVVGCEALLRWQHPERGMLCPDAFAVALEDVEFSPILGCWVIREALWQMSQWAPWDCICRSASIFRSIICSSRLSFRICAPV